MSIAGANIYEDSASLGKTTVNHTDSDTDTDPGSAPAPADHVHIDFDIAHQACLAEIASLFEDIQVDLRIITDRGDDRAKGIYQREADNVANNPANIAKAASDFINLQQSGILDIVNAEVGNPTNLGNTSAANYNAIRNNTSNPGGFNGGTEVNTQRAGYAGGTTTAITGADGETYSESSVPFDQLVPTAGSADGIVAYRISGIRNLPIQSQLWNILETAARAAGVNVTVITGGQVPTSEGGIPGKNRTGSNRFDKGFGSEVRLTDGDSNRLYTTDPAQLAIMIKFAEACRDAGATAIGMGNGYLGAGAIHIDIAWTGQKSNYINQILPLRYWGGKNGKTPPQYLQDLMTPKDNV
jgi:hypothetical protein|tara:strand:+ start:370 stop:1434 length:1065 start_codon:yes stop_codon:yes gene_type:complete